MWSAIPRVGRLASICRSVPVALHIDDNDLALLLGESMSQKEDQSKVTQRAEEFLHVFKKGAEFTQQLLRENEKLRFQLVQQEEQSRLSGCAGQAMREVESLKAQVAELEREKQGILQRIERVESENIDFANRYVEIEAENNSLANLYIATYQLHSTLDFRDVLKTISEIIINLIGGEEFAIFLLDENSKTLQAVAGEGVAVNRLPVYSLGEGPLGVVALSGESFFAQSLDGGSSTSDAPLACIPLKIKERVIGVLAVYKLFLQKRHFADIDYELFTLLAGHAATAIFASKLYSESERKLTTIQGFLDLLTK